MSTDYAIQKGVAIFNSFQILGFILQVVVLIPALFSARIHRMRTWYIMILSGIIYNLCYMPLMILGQQFGPAPSFALCLFQSCLIYCAPVLLVSFSLAFVVEVFLVLSHTLYGTSASSTRTHTLLLAVPSFIYMVVFSTTLSMGLQQPKTIERDKWSLYCHSTSLSPTLVTAIIVVIEASTMIILEVSMAVILWKTRRRLKSTGGNDNLSSIFPLSLFIRSLMFAVYILIGIGIGVSSIMPILTDNPPIWEMTLTTPPIVMALSFGIQKDTIAFYWSRKKGCCVEEIDSNKLV
ncbi:hypothetical protein ARMSODRAFT_966315 [Armillaria solidipes]|uniref:G-protein coupled receptors family 1 profile domain-containing protein n=1 Tax=Armillaria solidipes TaxID=1076256 RepID=A0A2H3AMR7_9AGAR|nr:hypothetical protein ARMSODRAFT_966315 [Armillaria solidipes]